MFKTIRSDLMNDTSDYVSVRKINSFYTIEDSLKHIYTPMPKPNESTVKSLLKIIAAWQKEIASFQEKLRDMEFKFNSFY